MKSNSQRVDCGKRKLINETNSRQGKTILIKMKREKESGGIEREIERDKWKKFFEFFLKEREREKWRNRKREKEQ